MAKTMYVGVNDIARKVKKAYVGVNGVARKIKKIYVGDDDGIARLCWGSGIEMFLTVGYNMSYSFDGINWTKLSQATMSSLPYYYSIAERKVVYGNNRFVCLGTRYVASGEQYREYFTSSYSEDGVNWSAVTDIYSRGYIYNRGNASNAVELVYGNGKFLLLPKEKSSSVNYNCNQYRYSTNGETWTIVTNNVSLNSDNHSNTAYGNGRFIRLDNSGTLQLLDGEQNWTRDTSNVTWMQNGSNKPTSNNFAVIYGRNCFVALPNSPTFPNGAYLPDGSNIWTATSFASWGSESKPLGTILRYGNGKFIGRFNNKTISYFDADTKQWRTTTANISLSVGAGTYAFGKHISLWSDSQTSVNDSVAISSDCVNWEKITLSYSSGYNKPRLVVASVDNNYDRS